MKNKYLIMQIDKNKRNENFFLDKNSNVTLDDIVKVTQLDGSVRIQLNFLKMKKCKELKA